MAGLSSLMGVCWAAGMHYDLQQACYGALAVPRHEARLRALDFSRARAVQLFEGFLVPVAEDTYSRSGASTVTSGVSTVTRLS